MAEEVDDLVLNTQRTWTYRICRSIVAGLALVLFRPRVRGAERIPLDGPVIIAPIHRSNVDFAFSIFLSRRKVFFMAKDGLYRVPLLGPLLLRLGAFPVRRGSADRESLNRAEEVLRRGQALILFPEGTRKHGPLVEPLRDGAMFIAARTRAKVVPVGIGIARGTDGSIIKGSLLARVTVVVGEPIEPPHSDQGARVSRRAVSEKSEELRAALQAVYAEARQS